jgi:2'-5' RNA ligase
VARVPGETGIVAVTDAAEPVVARWRDRYDEVAPLGVPAHVTVLYPFLRLGEITDAVCARLASIVAAEPVFEVTFQRFGRFPGTVLWLDPEPAEPFRRLTHTIWSAWPDHPPYAGQYDDVTPHLTVAEHVDDGLLDTIAAAVAPDLPVSTPVERLSLLAVRDGTWSTLAAFPLGAALTGGVSAAGRSGRRESRGSSGR